MTPFNKSDATMMRTAWELSAGLLSCIIALGLGYYVGGVLDRWLGTAPWLMGIFVALGLVAGGLNVFRAVSSALRPDAAQRPPTRRD